MCSIPCLSEGSPGWDAFQNPSNLYRVQQAGHRPWVGVVLGKLQTEMLKYFFDDFFVLNKTDDAHEFLAFGAGERVHLICLLLLLYSVAIRAGKRNQ
jgi:hypothetical protein